MTKAEIIMNFVFIALTLVGAISFLSLNGRKNTK